MFFKIFWTLPGGNSGTLWLSGRNRDILHSSPSSSLPQPLLLQCRSPTSLSGPSFLKRCFLLSSRTGNSSNVDGTETRSFFRTGKIQLYILHHQSSNFRLLLSERNNLQTKRNNEQSHPKNSFQKSIRKKKKKRGEN